jgi:hypothetical protein
MCGDVSNSYIRGSSIRNSNARCVTVHATNGAVVSMLKSRLKYQFTRQMLNVKQSAPVANPLWESELSLVRIGVQIIPRFPLLAFKGDWMGAVFWMRLQTWDVVSQKCDMVNISSEALRGHTPKLCHPSPTKVTSAPYERKILEMDIK